jgi:hypothetical protein
MPDLGSMRTHASAPTRKCDYSGVSRVCYSKGSYHPLRRTDSENSALSAVHQNLAGPVEREKYPLQDNGLV